MTERQTTESIAGTGMEYVGNVTFEPCNVTPETTYEGWMREAEIEFLLSREAAMILSFDDKALSKHLKRYGATEEERLNHLCDMVEAFGSWQKRFEAGQDVMRSVTCRLLVIAERWLGKDVMEHVGKEEKNTVN